MVKHYAYVGPEAIRLASQKAPTGTLIENQIQLSTWLKFQAEHANADGSMVATFVIGLDGKFRVAPRRSEHVACAGGGPVLSAGEATFLSCEELFEISNQSTGFCPEPESWHCVAAALDEIPILHPGEFTTKVLFRLCQGCCQRNLVKDDWFECGVCGAELPRQWNFADA